MTIKEKSQLRFEDALSSLEKVVQQLENGEIALEESLELFETGVRLAKVCSTKLDECEAKIELLMERNQELVREPFTAKDGAVGSE